VDRQDQVWWLLLIQKRQKYIENNRFGELEGLSIDLNTQSNVEAVDFQRGDGPNPPRNSPNRRQDTGNSQLMRPSYHS
jgi:hypothetical protein